VEEPVEVLDESVPHHVYQFDPYAISWASLRLLRRAVRAHRIRYVYWTDFPAWHWLYGLLRLWGVETIVVHSHVSVASPYPAEPERGLKRAVKVALHRGRWLSADHVLACSRFVKDRLVSKACYPAERISVIPYGLPDRSFNPADVSEPQANGTVRVVCAARATRVKGIHVLIEATRVLREQQDLPDFVVEFAGTGPDLDTLQEMVRDGGMEDTFRFLGYVDGVSGLLEGADIVVIPSIWGDAFPYSVLEAMAAGKPIVASHAGGIPEQLGDPPVGRLVPPGDAGALATALHALLLDTPLRAKLAKAADTRARSEFREERYFGEVVDHLRLALRSGA
jgi:glycosyltransferase involved in cell wall biosynthesis